MKSPLLHLFPSSLTTNNGKATNPEADRSNESFVLGRIRREPLKTMDAQENQVPRELYGSISQGCLDLPP